MGYQTSFRVRRFVCALAAAFAFQCGAFNAKAWYPYGYNYGYSGYYSPYGSYYYPYSSTLYGSSSIVSAQDITIIASAWLSSYPETTTTAQDIATIAAAWLNPSEAENTSLTITGDANSDSLVNGQDVAIIADHWLQSGAGVAGDVNFDSLVNAQDVAVIADHWLEDHSTAQIAGVPEPATILLAALGAVSVTALRLSQRKRRSPAQR